MANRQTPIQRLLRLLVRIERRAPFAISGLAFFVGQLLVLSSQSYMLFGCVTCLALILSRLSLLSLAKTMLPLLVGMLSGFLLVGRGALDMEQHQDLSLLVSLDSQLRHRHPGGVESIGEVLHVVDPTDTTEKLLHARILLRAKDLPWFNSSSWQKGDIVFLRGDFSPLQAHALESSYEGSLLRKGVLGRFRVRFASRAVAHSRSLFSKVRQKIISHVRHLLGNDEDSGLLLSLLVGRRDTLRRSTDEAFRSAGLSHVLVVSGFHVSMIFFLLVSILRVIRAVIYAGTGYVIPSFFEVLTALLFSLLFVGICGFEPSGLRACMALGFFCLAHQVGGRALSWGGWSSCLVCLSCLWPACILDIGVQYTFAALGGILLVTQRDPLRVPQVDLKGAKVSEYIRVSCAATFTTGLVSWIHFGTFPYLGFLFNLFLAPLFVLIGTKLGYFALGLHFLGLDTDGVMLSLCRDVLSWMKEFVLFVTF